MSDLTKLARVVLFFAYIGYGTMIAGFTYFVVAWAGCKKNMHLLTTLSALVIIGDLCYIIG